MFRAFPMNLIIIDLKTHRIPISPRELITVPILIPYPTRMEIPTGIPILTAALKKNQCQPGLHAFTPTLLVIFPPHPSPSVAAGHF